MSVWVLYWDYKLLLFCSPNPPFMAPAEATVGQDLSCCCISISYPVFPVQSVEKVVSSTMAQDHECVLVLEWIHVDFGIKVCPPDAALIRCISCSTLLPLMSAASCQLFSFLILFQSYFHDVCINPHSRCQQMIHLKPPWGTVCRILGGMNVPLLWDIDCSSDDRNPVHHEGLKSLVPFCDIL